MSSEKKAVSFKARHELRERIDAYQQRFGHEDRTAALRELVAVGLREQQNPILWRFKSRVIEWINLLSISAVVVFVIGAVTGIYRVNQGIVAAFAMLFLAVVLLGVYEAMRVVAGTSELGAQARTVVNWVSTSDE